MENSKQNKFSDVDIKIYSELDGICTNIPGLYVVSGTLNSEPSILNRPLGNQ